MYFVEHFQFLRIISGIRDFFVEGPTSEEFDPQQPIYFFNMSF